MNASDLQVRNNAALDNGGLEDPVTMNESSWSLEAHLRQSIGRIPRFVLDYGESETCNREYPACFKTPAVSKPLHPNGAIENPENLILKQGLPEKTAIEDEARDDEKIDQEIEEIEREISPLSSRLVVAARELSSRLEAAAREANQKLKLLEKKGRVVPAKFMEQKPSGKIEDGARKIEESLLLGSARMRIKRKGV